MARPLGSKHQLAALTDLPRSSRAGRTLADCLVEESRACRSSPLAGTPLGFEADSSLEGSTSARVTRLEEELNVQITLNETLLQEMECIVESLEGAGVLKRESFLARIHRRHFRSILRDYPLESEVSFADVLETGGLARVVALALGPLSIRALRATARRPQMVAVDLEHSMTDLFSRCIFVCGGFDGAEEVGDIEKLQPDLGVWETVAPMMKRRTLCSCVICGGMLYVCGGLAVGGKRYIKSAERFDPTAGRWEVLPDMTERKGSCSAATLGDVVYLAGGSTSETELASVERLDPSCPRLHWEALAPMFTKRSFAASAPIAGRFVLAGGTSGGEAVSSAEVFNPVDCSWTALPSMHTPRANAAVAVVGLKFYVCGGWDGVNRFSMLESLDFSTDVGTDFWTTLAPMSVPRTAPGCGVLGGRIYVCGGRNEREYLCSAERYSPQTGTWETLTPLSGRRGEAAVVVCDGLLYVCGGHDGEEFRRSVERYNPRAGSWELIAPMRTRRASACATALWTSPTAVSPTSRVQRAALGRDA